MVYLVSNRNDLLNFKEGIMAQIKLFHWRNHRPGFWFFQLAGWGTFLLFDFMMDLQLLNSGTRFLAWIFSGFTGFTLSLVL
jgi:hypothetical protein